VDIEKVFEFIQKLGDINEDGTKNNQHLKNLMIINGLIEVVIPEIQPGDE